MVSLPPPSVCTLSESSNSLVVLIKHYCQEPFGVSLPGHIVSREWSGQSLRRGVKGSVVVVSTEQEESPATGQQYASYTTCQFTLSCPEMSLKLQYSSHYSPGMASGLLLATSGSLAVLARHSAKHAP